MPQKHTITIVAALTGLVLIIFAVVVSGLGKSLLEKFNSMKPIYRECRIEGRNFNSVQPSDCQNFDRKVQNGEIPDGEYSVYAKYANKSLSDNIIPVKIENGKTSCNFIDNGYVPSINAVYGKDDTGPIAVQEGSEIPVGSDGLIIQILYYKNSQRYFYDTNICKSALSAEITDADGNTMGKAGLNQKTFLSTRPLVNEIMINNKPSYEQNGEIVENFKAGNVFARFNFAPGISYKLTIPCSAQQTMIIIPNLETDKNIAIPFKGLNAEYVTTCGSKLYLTLQNTNRPDDIQTLEDIKLEFQNSSPIATYKMYLDQIDLVIDPGTTFPISFQLNLNLKDRSDSTKIFTLASSVLTITGYTPGNDEMIIPTVFSAEPQNSENRPGEEVSAAAANNNITEGTSDLKPVTSGHPKIRKDQPV